jgi:integrase/recombinase XerD
VEFRAYRKWQVFDDRGRRKYLNDAERMRLIAATVHARADIRALCLVLAFTGCRISEALALTPDHLDRDAGTLTFRTLKRRSLHFRSVPIPDDLSKMLSELHRNSGAGYWPMHRVTAWRHIKLLLAHAEVVGPMACCRGLRHGFGIRASSCGVPPNLTQRWMGHAYLSTTAIYLDAVGNEERGFAERMWRPPTGPRRQNVAAALQPPCAEWKR